jgi:hypothetical protein
VDLENGDTEVEQRLEDDLGRLRIFHAAIVQRYEQPRKMALAAAVESVLVE